MSEAIDLAQQALDTVMNLMMAYKEENERLLKDNIRLCEKLAESYCEMKVTVKTVDVNHE